MTWAVRIFRLLPVNPCYSPFKFPIRMPISLSSIRLPFTPLRALRLSRRLPSALHLSLVSHSPRNPGTMQFSLYTPTYLVPTSHTYNLHSCDFIDTSPHFRLLTHYLTQIYVPASRHLSSPVSSLSLSDSCPLVPVATVPLCSKQHSMNHPPAYKFLLILDTFRMHCHCAIPSPNTVRSVIPLPSPLPLLHPHIYPDPSQYGVLTSPCSPVPSVLSSAERINAQTRHHMHPSIPSLLSKPLFFQACSRRVRLVRSEPSHKHPTVNVLENRGKRFSSLPNSIR
ncbi:hypothetical protein R3P38DRAFT_3194924 [Favolaschia claudopus]|uniref:Uncharacterized protein n=1 Tax=Favolaschia claudopus TaxID=2862362 RepID=A0AAW0BBJ8_9AGAR